MTAEEEQKLREIIGNDPKENYTFEGDDITFIKEMTVTVESGGNFYNGSIPKPKAKKDADKETNILKAIKGCFFGKEDVARKFLNDIVGVKPTQVIDIVGEYLKSNDLSKLSCRRDLWTVLHENGYYEPSESNWDKAINKL